MGKWSHSKVHVCVEILADVLSDLPRFKYPTPSKLMLARDWRTAIPLARSTRQHFARVKFSIAHTSNNTRSCRPTLKDLLNSCKNSESRLLMPIPLRCFTILVAFSRIWKELLMGRMAYMKFRLWLMPSGYCLLATGCCAYCSVLLPPISGHCLRNERRRALQKATICYAV